MLIVQANAFNKSRISTVIIAAITSNLALGQAPGNVAIAKADSGLSKRSVINVSQLLTIDRKRLTQRVGRLPGRIMERTNEGIRLVLGV